MSDAENAAFEIESMNKEISKVETISELDSYLKKVDSIVVQFPELKNLADSLIYRNREKWKADIIKEQKSLLAIRAFSIAQEAVKQRLKAPSTAKFASYTEDSSKSWEKKGIYFCQFWVDSQNGFGAMIRTRWQVKLRPVAEKLKVIDIMQY